jgi:acetyl-CoA/propionyl-CoA carboxylase biotin carboxyl carrier protein
MRLLGDKVSAKDVAARAGVPVAPWTRITGDPSPAEIQTILNQIGLPALIKAAHGGGGRGQRIVKEAAQFTESLRTARSESLRSFGSAEVFVERFLERPRHIEVQILADTHGHVFTLGERDCTVQRRNQKVIEESPAVILDPLTRTKIHAAARSQQSPSDTRTQARLFLRSRMNPAHGNSLWN